LQVSDGGTPIALAFHRFAVGRPPSIRQSMIAKDLSFAVRTLRKNPAFTITAVLTIALGVGASTAIFSVVNAVLLRPLPYAHADQLAMIETDMLARHVNNFPIAPGNMPDLLDHATAFEHIAAVNSGPAPFMGDEGKPEQIIAAGVTPNFFTMLGTRIGFGRNFVASDATPPPPPQVVNGQRVPPNPADQPPAMTILSHAFWQRRFGGDSSVIGKTVQLFGGPATIVGVAPADLRLEFPSGIGNNIQQPDAYSVFRIDWSTASRINVFLRVIGRLKTGASLGAARAQLTRLTADLQAKLPILKGANAVWRAEPMQADVVKDVRPAILALMGAVMFVLLIACANVANLLLVRASARERELAVRSALGGTRSALVGQMLAESVVLAGAGALLGLFFAKIGIDLLLSIAPSNLPRADDVSIDFRVLAFTGIIAFASALIFGMLPAWRASRPNLGQTLRAGGRSPGLHSGKYLRQGVVIAEVALSFVLLIGSGLMLRSFMVLERVDPGFDPNGILTFTAFNARARTAVERQAFASTLAKRLSEIPGVTAVTAASPLPLDGQDFNLRWGPPAAAENPSLFQQAAVHFVLPGYFEAMKTKLVAGRTFTQADNDTTTIGIVIDNLLAAKAFPGQSPQSVIGKQILARIITPEAKNYQIIGVVEHERHLGLATPGREGAFVVDGMPGFGAATRWAVRTNGDPTRLIPAARAALAQVDAQVPMGEVTPMSAYVDRAMAPTRFSLVLIAIFGAVAAVLAAVGLYGVLSTTVRQRTAEIGVRMAFGATNESIFRLMIGQGLALSAVGIGVGIAAALALTGVMERANMLISIKPNDPLTYVAIAVLFVVIASLASWVPARRAASLDPNAALREE
jgi:putative ABC transport system permease protein